MNHAPTGFHCRGAIHCALSANRALSANGSLSANWPSLRTGGNADKFPNADGSLSGELALSANGPPLFRVAAYFGFQIIDDHHGDIDVECVFDAL